ncbi:MAG TPA: transporter [Xanthobacteraceae bacterium]|jgi:drug/metabolite transporter (DMT)-like permease
MSDDRLTLWQIVLLAAYAAGMSGGQLLFKMAALRYGAAAGGLGERLLGLALNAYFIAALILYAGFAILWVWILSFIPLSRAYPFVALAFALTPLLAGLLFGDTISFRLIAGIFFILCGLFLVTT